jgi:hypothetical protein
MLLLFIKKISSFLRSEGKKEAALPFGQPDRLSLHGLPSQAEGLSVSKESKTASILNNFGGTPDIPPLLNYNLRKTKNQLFVNNINMAEIIIPNNCYIVLLIKGSRAAIDKNNVRMNRII